MYEISKKYRSIHSINDVELSRILFHFAMISSPATFLDYGCHLGHLSIELAIRYPIEIIAVDTFLSSYNNSLFKKEGDFKAMFESNVKEACSRCQMLGKIKMLSPEMLFAIPPIVDMAFIDSSHELEDVKEFVAIGKMITNDGIIGGYDYNPRAPGVMAGVQLLENDFDHLPGGGTCFFMKRKTD